MFYCLPFISSGSRKTDLMGTWVLLLIKRKAQSALRGYMIKKFLINWLLPMVIDQLIAALKSLSMRSSNTVDDALADTVERERDNIINEIKANL